MQFYTRSYNSVMLWLVATYLVGAARSKHIGYKFPIIVSTTQERLQLLKVLQHRGLHYVVDLAWKRLYSITTDLMTQVFYKW